MSAGNEIYRFGSFELDSARHRLMRAGRDLAPPDPYVRILLRLVSAPGQIASKESLVKAGWQDLAVTDNSVDRAISVLRSTLGQRDDGAPYIETVTRRGYRFIGAVECVTPRRPAASLDALLAPHRAFVDGRAALETLDRKAIASAREAFEQALKVAPESTAAHIGLANACLLEFESTRVDAAPDVVALQHGDLHAREACRLDDGSGEAWSALAFALHRQGHARDAIAAARRALSLESSNWRHWVRLAYVSWGEERLAAAQQVSRLCPELALAHWFSATVFVARQAFDPALKHLRDGCAAQDAQRNEAGRFRAVGLHLLHGLVLAARAALDDAIEEFASELASHGDGHVYARECAANTWYARGAIRLRQGDRDDAAVAFREATTRVPGHVLAAVGLAAAVSPVVTTGAFLPLLLAHAGQAGRNPNPVDAEMAKAAGLSLLGDHVHGAQLCAEALSRADAGSAGWMLPVDPLIAAMAHRDAWAQTLAILCHRAT